MDIKPNEITHPFNQLVNTNDLAPWRLSKRMDLGLIKDQMKRVTLLCDQQIISPNSSTPSTATLTTSSPSLRFAMRVRMHSNDLPEGLVFDPQSNAIIPKTVLIERGQRAALNPPSSPLNSGASYREKVIIFPRNIHVSDAIEHTLEAFGIADGVVDGGDDIDDKLSKRRNSAKIRYGLSMLSHDSTSEVPVNLISKVLDSYQVPPILRPADRTSKEARRRSQEYHPFVLGTIQDLQPTDPIFSLRRALHHHPVTRRDSYRTSTSNHNGLVGAVADELSALQNTRKNSLTGSPVVTSPPPPHLSTLASRPPAPSTQASFRTASESLYSSTENESIPTTVSSSNPVAVVSTILIRKKEKKRAISQSYRYSYFDPSGEEYDISELIERELTTPQDDYLQQEQREEFKGKNGETHQRNISLDRSTTHTHRDGSPSTTEGDDGYASAPESPLSSVYRLSPSHMRNLTPNRHVDADHDDEDEDSAIEALRAADLTIDQDLVPLLPIQKN
ncbi:hypothetical protein Pst134EA_031593 [Puccinia striiformis f. sp. tritici]|uniref:uncharacterized protein n=1 Tax=Puccinia striiformis f. sp. tritici TaxID=168172 RepID=UPI002008273D|nr:uncharacterized protein Pst134EA_031593 [Puccinia striiformis f. sp. tritici]KAH9442745.1 hypothetical protein Pst134EA_031593 [Puccinia striiformis f. sp. tritici]